MSIYRGDVETFTLHSLNWPSLSAHTVYTLHPLVFKLPPSPSLSLPLILTRAFTGSIHWIYSLEHSPDLTHLPNILMPYPLPPLTPYPHPSFPPSLRSVYPSMSPFSNSVFPSPSAALPGCAPLLLHPLHFFLQYDAYNTYTITFTMTMTLL